MAGNSVLAFGELVWDIYPDSQILGGAPTNLVFRLNSFSHEAHLLTRVGDDQLGHEAIKKVAELGISTENIQRDNVFPTGTVNVVIDSEGQPDYNIQRDVAYDHIELSSDVLRLIKQTRCICFGTLVQRYGISKNTLREIIHESKGSIKFLDLKLRKNCYTGIILESSLNFADILRLKESELYSLKRELGLKGEKLDVLTKELIWKYNIELVLVTKGKNGVFGMDNKNNYYQDPGYMIEQKDTVGAGIAFSAGFLHYYLNGKSVEEAINFGNATGAMVASTTGATSFVRKKDILKLIKTGKRR